MNIQNLQSLLPTLDKSLLIDFFSEYSKLKKEQLLGNWANCLIHCGQFAELTLGLIKSLYDGKPINKNQISFEKFYNDLINRPKPNPEDEILLLAVPNALRTIYTIRNKKRGAHAKAIDPNYLDSVISTTNCDWVLSQILLLKGKSTNSQEIYDSIQSIVSKQIPLIEEFEDGSIIVLNKQISFQDKLLLTIYHIDKRVSYDELMNLIGIKKRKKITDAMKNLRNKLLIHQNDKGIRLTRLGLKTVENIIEKNSSMN